MKYIMMVLAATAVLTFAGCAGTPNEDRGKIAVTYGVLKLVEQSDDIDGDRVLDAVERVRAGVSTGSGLVSPDGLVDIVMGQLDLEGLSPADRFLVQSVIGQVQTGLLDDVESGVLPEDYAAQLNVWLDWIEEAAYMAGAGRDE